MSAFLKFLENCGKVLSPRSFHGSGYHIPQRGESRNDFAKLSADMRAVGGDLRRTAERELVRRGK